MKRISVVFIGLVWLSIGLFGQDLRWRGGIIIPRPPIERVLPVKLVSEEAKITINNGVASVQKRQLFKNSMQRVMEGTYIFPLPNEAFINEFSLYINNERITGEMLTAVEAKKIYEDIVRKFRDPALLEMIGNNLFRANIFPFDPMGERKIEVKYTQLLKPHGNTYRFVYPLGQVSAGEVKQSAEMEINHTGTIGTIYSPTHDISVENLNPNKAKIKISLEKGSGDFILYYTASANEIDVLPLVYEKGNEKPYFMLRLTPVFSNENKTAPAKNVTFVIDVSGSMMGKKIEQAKKALEFCLNNLNGSDNFSIITFSNSAGELTSMASADNKEYMKTALNKVRALEADGGTNLNQALLLGLEKISPAKPNYLILLTDGLPTVGVRNPDEITKNIKKNIKQNTRIFCFGVGNDVDAFLLDKIAGDYRGSSNYVREHEDMEIEVASFFGKISNPALTDCKIDFGNLDVYDVYPKELPDLFSGSSLFIFGRMPVNKSGTVTLTGNTGDRQRKFTYKIESTSDVSGNQFVANLWANRKIAFLLDEIRNNGENKELIDEVIKLSKQYGIITPYTSYLVTEDEGKDIGADKPMIKKNQLYDAASGYAPLSREEKESMVSQSVTLGKMKNSSRANVYKSMKNVEGKSFIQKDEFWVDSEFDELNCKDTVKLAFGSDEYFNLISKDDSLRKYCSISDKLKIVYKGKCYIIE